MSSIKRFEKALNDYNKIVDRVRQVCDEYNYSRQINGTSFYHGKKFLTEEDVLILNRHIDDKINRGYIPNKLGYKDISIKVDYFINEKARDGAVWQDQDGFRIFVYKNHKLVSDNIPIEDIFCKAGV